MHDRAHRQDGLLRGHQVRRLARRQTRAPHALAPERSAGVDRAASRHRNQRSQPQGRHCDAMTTIPRSRLAPRRLLHLMPTKGSKTTMSDIDNLYPSKYLKPADLGGKEVIVTIAKVVVEEIGQPK